MIGTVVISAIACFYGHVIYPVANLFMWYGAGLKPEEGDEALFLQTCGTLFRIHVHGLMAAPLSTLVWQENF